MDTQTSYREARRLIDKEIADVTARMHHSVRLLKTRRNELSPAVNIPDEILLKIFLLIRDSFDVPNKWHPITQICQHWRRVALSSASLWNRIHITSHAAISLMLKRSRTAPLDVCFSDVPRHDFHAALTAIFHEIERVRSLSFTWMVPGSLLETTQAILGRLDRKATLLEELTVEITSHDRDCPVFVLDAFRPTHLLRKLRLTGVPYSWNILPFPSLTQLTLHGRETSTKVLGAQFTDALRQMQHLQNLSINLSSIPLHQYTPSTNLQPIHLPCLRQLEIMNEDSHQEPIETFMSQMSHPQLDQLSIHLRGTVVNHSTMIRLIGSSVSKGDFRSLAALQIDFEEFKIYSLPGLSRQSFVQVAMTLGDDENDLEVTDFEFVTEIMSCCITPFDSSKTLSLEHLCLSELHLPVEQFTSLFAHLPHLTSVQVDDQIGLLDALNSGFNDATPTASLPFPKLQSLTWKARIFFYAHRDSTLAEPVLCNLYNCLSARKAHGNALSRLHLIAPQSCLSISQIKRLKEVVATVIVRQG